MTAVTFLMLTLGNCRVEEGVHTVVENILTFANYSIFCEFCVSLLALPYSLIINLNADPNHYQNSDSNLSPNLKQFFGQANLWPSRSLV